MYFLIPTVIYACVMCVCDVVLLGNGRDPAGKGPRWRRGERSHARPQAISHPHQSTGQTRAR